MPRSAVDEYPARQEHWRLEHSRRAREDRSVANLRLVVFAAAVGLGVLASRGVASAWWLMAPAAAFLFLLARHDRVIRRRDAAARLVVFYERGLARVHDRWIGTGDDGERFLDTDHRYSADLDLFGHGSLFELLSIARTRAGEATLADWLRHPATRPALLARHAAVAELRDALDLREGLALAGDQVRHRLHADQLTHWATASPTALPTPVWAIGLGLSIVLPLLLIAWWLNGWLWPLVTAILLRLLYQQLQGERIEAIVGRADTAARELDILRPALRLLESQSFASPLLVSLQDDLGGSRQPASASIRTLVRYAEMHDWTHNIVFTPIAALLMWDTHLAWAVERWRAAHGGYVGAWLRSVGTLEALASLAAYAYEHPDDPFPSVVDGTDPDPAIPVFEGVGLGHPLLPAARMVRNDVALGPRTQLLVVSGSNMSGKSTLLRTVGVNAVLALAGAPVRATSLRISPIAIGATLRIQDSLQQGRSRFFAEITRVRDIAALAAARPTLFLLDELFHGTNSHDRLVGAAGVLRSLLDHHAIGLITTHDLALTAITTELGARAANVHFEDTFADLEMRFDYRMKAGPVTRSNALALMRAVGLDVEEETP